MSDNSTNILSNTTEHVLYPAERSKQEVGHMKETVSKVAEPHVNRAQNNISRGVEEAQVKGSELTSQTGQAVDQFQEGMSAKTDQAVDEGRRSVDEAKATGAGYLQQAKETVTDVANAAQDYVSIGLDEHTPADINGTNLVSSLQSAAHTAYETGKSYLAAAQETAEPHVRKAQETVQPHAEGLIEAAKPYVSKAQSALSSMLGSGTNSNSEQNGKDDTPKV